MKVEMIIKEKHPDIYNWLSEYVWEYEKNQSFFILTECGKISSFHNVDLKTHIKEIKYHFKYVKGYFDCSCCYSLTSFKGCPELVNGIFSFSHCESITSFIGFPKKVNGSIYFPFNNFSNTPLCEKSYNLYINMWFELLESASEDDRCRYINNYKDKTDTFYNHLIIPKEVTNKYKIDFLLNEK